MTADAGSRPRESGEDGTWKDKLPGRDILKKFVSIEKISINYEVLRNLIVNRMAELGYKPLGMKNVIDQIKND